MPIEPSRRFPRAGRLTKRSDFRRVFHKGSRSEGRYLVAIGLGSGRSHGRLGLAVGRRVGGAVARNRVKRRLREWFRKHRATAAGGLDLVLVAKPGLHGCSAAVAEAELLRCLAAVAGTTRRVRRRAAAGD